MSAFEAEEIKLLFGIYWNEIFLAIGLFVGILLVGTLIELWLKIKGEYNGKNGFTSSGV